MKLGNLVAGLLPLAAASFTGEFRARHVVIQPYLTYAPVYRLQYILHARCC
jgi:hypothetical protein